MRWHIHDTYSYLWGLRTSTMKVPDRCNGWQTKAPADTKTRNLGEDQAKNGKVWNKDAYHFQQT